METSVPAPPTDQPQTAVLKGRRAKKSTEIRYWKGMAAVWIGIALAFSGFTMYLTLGGNFSSLCFLLGLGLFILGMTIELTVLAIRIIRER